MGRKHRHGKRIFQDSPFLDMPGELRMMIYEAALVKSTPIDLCPHKYVEMPENDPLLMSRIAKEQANPPNFLRGGELWIPKFRKQDDLLYVRKEMATGLLATCKQICQEATSVFWCKNTFRFSADGDWLFVRRFLLTIGPNAIRRLPTMEVFMPLCFYPSSADAQRPIEQWRALLQAKNVPKLHMAKVGSGAKIASAVEETDNMKIVASLLREAKSTLELRFIVPCGFALNQSDWSPGVQPELFIPEELQTRQPFTKIALVVESGAYVYGSDVPENIAGDGLDVFLMPGSYWKEALGTSDEEGRVTELKRWENAQDKFEFLNGVEELMEESENNFAVPSRGGKVNKSPGKKKVERILKGFGGCRFISRFGYDCSGCPTTRFEPHQSPIGNNSIWANCEGCGQWLLHNSREGVVVVKKRARYLRLAESV